MSGGKEGDSIQWGRAQQKAGPRFQPVFRPRVVNKRQQSLFQMHSVCSFEHLKDIQDLLCIFALTEIQRPLKHLFFYPHQLDPWDRRIWALGDLTAMLDLALDPYDTGISSTQKTVTIVDAVVNLVAPSVTSIWKKKSFVQSLKARLGEWVHEAKDAQDRWLQPVLAKQAFEDHLAKNGGIFQPSGDCTSSFAWARLLYALNIRPGNGIISWRLPAQETDPAKTGVVSLAIHGERCATLSIFISCIRQDQGGGDIDNTYFRLPFGVLKV